MSSFSLRRQIAFGISQISSGLHHFAAPRYGLRILMYHSIGGTALGDTRGLFSLSSELFLAHVNFLAEHYENQVCSLQPEHQITNNDLQIAITFDDGYLDNLRVAAPILAERRLPFTIFASSEFIRNCQKDFLSPSNLRELASIPGVTIGAHGASHVALAECNDQKLMDELSSSRKYLEDVIGAPVVTMSYPHGSADSRVGEAANDAGYSLAACSYSDINTPTRNTLFMCRTEVLAGDTLRIFQQKLKGNWDWYRWRTTDPSRL